MMDMETMLAILFRVSYLRGRMRAEQYPFKAQLLEEWQHFSQQFATEEACYSFLYQQKWPDGFRCPQCHCPNACKIVTRRMPLYQCQDCYHQTTLTARTLMDRSRIPLQKWLMAFFFLTRQQLGVNAFQLHLLLEVTYKTAWSMHKKIRLMISQANDQHPIGNFSSLFSNSSKPICIQQSESTTTATTTTPSSLPLHGMMFERAFGMRPVMLGFSLRNYPVQTNNNERQIPVVTDVRLQIIPHTQMTDSNTVSSSYITSFKEHSFCKQLLPTQIIPAQTMVYRPKRAVQNTFDVMMKRLYQTYGFIREKYLQQYYNELCFYYMASVKTISTFSRLSKLSVASRI